LEDIFITLLHCDDNAKDANNAKDATGMWKQVTSDAGCQGKTVER
jgi:hypothetical protein